MTNHNNITSDTFGRDCCAVNFIIAMNKMRFKQGKGDPSDFKQFLRQHNIKPSIIIRYVGNRFHVMFHLAGVLYYLREKLLIYLDKSCNNTTTLRTSLLKEKRIFYYNCVHLESMEKWSQDHGCMNYIQLQVFQTLIA